MFPFYKTGLVERYLERAGISEAEFAPRFALRCLWTLQREIRAFAAGAAADWSELPADEASPQSGPDGYRRHVLHLLRSALEKIA